MKASFISTQVTSGSYYYLNLTPAKDANETVVCGGKEQCAPEYRIERDTFKYHSIEYVVAGNGRLTYHGKTYDLRPGMIYYYGPRTPHIIQTNPDNPLLKHFVDFVGKNFTDILRHTVFKNNVPLHAAKPFLIQSIFDNLIVTGNTPGKNRDALCNLLLRQLILQADDTATDADIAASASWQTYMRCRQYIEQNYLDIHTVKEVARACHVDQAYLTRLFKRFSDISPNQLINQSKMRKAAELLNRKDMLIKQVAEMIGYSDPYHFSRVFKRVYGVSPKSFAHVTR